MNETQSILANGSRRVDREVYIVTDKHFQEFVHDVSQQKDSYSQKTLFVKMVVNREHAKEFASYDEAIIWLAGYVRAGIIFKDPQVVKVNKRSIYSPPKDAMRDVETQILTDKEAATFLSIGDEHGTYEKV